VLCLSDTETERLSATGLALDELVRALGECAAREQLVWLDACHSGGLALGTEAAAPTTQVLQEYASRSQGFYAMLSCAPEEYSWEFADLGHGVFTYFLIRGLRGEAADAQGRIDADGLYRYVYHRTLRYIDGTNQQIRLINQQRRLQGSGPPVSEYPLQTPRRIVAAAGEARIGLKTHSRSASPVRQALILAGLSGSTALLALGKALSATGGFAIEYWPQTAHPWSEIRQAFVQRLSIAGGDPEGTLLVYLQGRLERDSETESGRLVFGDGIRLDPLWLRQQLTAAASLRQIIILDCPAAGDLSAWIDALTLGSERGQCLLVASSPTDDPDHFVRTFVEVLDSAEPATGLTAARCIAQLQLRLAESGTHFCAVLGGTLGVIDLVPQGQTALSTDLNLCPYMGLRAFAEADASYFFGRELLVGELTRRLDRESFLAVVGASGSGKSSLVQAGLMHQLRRGTLIPGSESWWVGSLRPGAHPVEALCRRLALSEREAKALEGLVYLGADGFVRWLRAMSEPMVVLVVDQFEEVWTLAGQAERQVFLAALLGALEHAADRFKLVVTLRADFVAACLEENGLGERLRPASFLVSPLLSEEDYRRVIVEPARLVGLTVEPELVEVLLGGLSRSAGDLPLLEFVLTQLWELRHEGRLTLAAYRQQIGGLQGALEKKAQQTFEAMSPEEQECARWIFLSLTQLGEGTEDTRRRVRRSELSVRRYPEALVQATLRRLTEAKLVVVGFEESELTGRSRSGEGVEADLDELRREVTVEVAHEVLIRHWSTLKWWLEKNRDRLRTQREVEQAAVLWKQKGEEESRLLRGAQLAEAEEKLVRETADELSSEVLRFIDASLAERREREKKEHLQQEKERRQYRQARIAATVMGILGTVAIGFGGLAYWQTQKAQLSTVTALSASAEGYLNTNRQLEALLTALKAKSLLDRTLGADTRLRMETESTLQYALSVVREQNRLEGHTDWISRIAVSPDGHTYASAGADGTVRLWDHHGTPLHVLSGHTGGARGANFSPDGRTLATVGRDGRLRLWDTVSGHLLKQIRAHQGVAYQVVYSPDGRILATAGGDGHVRLWTVQGDLIRALSTRNQANYSIAFSSDSSLLATVQHAGFVQLWRRDGSPIATLATGQAAHLDLAFHPRERILAVASDGGEVYMWDWQGHLLRRFRAHTQRITSVAFNPNGHTLATGGADQSIRLWTLDGQLRETIQPGAAPNSLVFPDEHRLVSADQLVRVWNLDSEWQQTLEGHSDAMWSVGYSPDGRTIASGGVDGTVRFWNSDGTHRFTLQNGGTVYALAFSPKGQSIATVTDGSGNMLLQIWSLTGKRISSRQLGLGPLLGVAFHPDGRQLAVATANGQVALLKDIGGPVRVLVGHRGAVYGVAFSPDGQRLVSVGNDGKGRLWDLKGHMVAELRGHTAAINNVAVSSDSRWIATAGEDHTVRLWTWEGRLTKVLENLETSIGSVAFSADSRILAAAGANGTVTLWNPEGEQLQTLKISPKALNTVSFSPDNQHLLTAGLADKVFLHRLLLDRQSLSASACNWLHDYLSSHRLLAEEQGITCKLSPQGEKDGK
jgi:WD40 repeat protein/energy-coupling factor transporter ATP-binding protein EcfA2